jgi:diaminopimelate epimerase
MTLPFIKMHGLGNDYVYIDCFQPETAALLAKADLAALARRVSDRHFGIGSDGLVLILPSKEADAKMRIFNADGSEAEMCGNAIRCVVKYLYESGLCPKTHLFVETLAGIRALTLRAIQGQVLEVTVNMGAPHMRPDVLMRGDDPIGFSFVNIGNPHAVFFRHSLQQIEEITTYGQLVSTHPHFPEGTNVEFAYVRNVREIDVRVWERGSGITLACGTGACAAAVAAIQNSWTERNVTVHLPGGDLDIRWERDTDSVFMTGSATEVFRGEYIEEDEQ